MKIGVPKEIKPQENRIGLTPDSVKTLVGEGHEVLVENNGGFEAGFDNDQYTKAGAKIAKTAGDIFNDADIIVKVKEPLPEENQFLSSKHTLFTYLHLAGNKENAKKIFNLYNEFFKIDPKLKNLNLEKLLEKLIKIKPKKISNKNSKEIKLEIYEKRIALIKEVIGE